MARKIGGTAYLKINGTQVPLRGMLLVSPSAFERAMQGGQDYVHGYLENVRVPWIEGDLSTVPELSAETLLAQDDVTVTAELNNGRTYVLKEAATKGAFEIN